MYRRYSATPYFIHYIVYVDHPMITIEVIAPPSNEDAITRIAKQNEASDLSLIHI